MPPRFNRFFRAALLASRWGMAPFCLGLVAALLIVLVQFLRELAYDVTGLPEMDGSAVILAVLKLVDLVLVANLVVMIISAGVEIFLPSVPASGEERPESSKIVDFAGLKLRLFASISAIAAIDLLESFVNTAPAEKNAVLWEIAMLLAFVVSGVMLALMDRLASDQRG